MRAYVLLILILMLCSFPAMLHGKNPSVDWIFVIDTSGSMRGQGGTADIFDEVQRAVKRFVDLSNRGDSITVISFDQAVENPASRYIGGRSDKISLSKEIDDLQARGLFTHTGEAVQRALERQEELHESDREVCIILLTDGIEDTRDRPNALHLQDVHIPPADRRPYTIFVWLGESEDEFRNSSLYTFKERLGRNNTRVLFHPEARNIEALATEVRDLINPIIIVDPTEFDLGTVEPGGTTDAQDLSIKSSRPTRVQMILSDIGKTQIVLVDPAEDFDINEDSKTVSVRFRTDSGVPSGPIQGTLLAYEYRAFDSSSRNNPVLAAVPFRVVVASPSIPARLSRAFAYFVGIFTFLILGLCVYHQESPKELLRRWTMRKQLVGFLEVGSGTTSELIDLSVFRSGTSYKGIATPYYSGSSDAELVRVKEGGRKLVVIQKAEGIISVNGKRLGRDAAMELFNLDEINIDGEKVIYHGPERS